MFFKLLIIILLGFVLYSLGAGLYYLLKDEGQSKRVLKTLTLRVGISLAVFILLLFAAQVGWIQPHGV